MIFNFATFSTLLETLSLTQGSFKPDPGSYSTSTVAVNNATDAPGLSSSSSMPNVSSIGNIAGVLALESDNLPMTAENNCNVDPYTAPELTHQTFPPFDQNVANVYRYRRQQSVNLGSWFAHENWMTPSVFRCASGKQLSELDIASGWGNIETARAVLERHWDTFITQSDFQYLASIGINTVRLPIGYWSLGPYYCQDTPFANVADVYVNSWSRIIRAINMAGEAGIGVLVDLHGAVGSQNGQPHSGISDGATNLFDDLANVDKTVAALVFLTQQLASVNNIVGIQILNEPKNVPTLEDFYSKAIAAMRQTSPNAASLPLYLHNGFDLDRFTGYVSSRTDFVVQDHHSYFVFTPPDEAEPASQHTGDVHSAVASKMAIASARQRGNLVIDEWSCALTPESMANEADKNQARKDFCTGQQDVYTNTTAGWSFWSYLKEGCENDMGWCFRTAVGRSLPATFFSYGQGPMANKWQITTVIANMAVPSTSDILAKPSSIYEAAPPGAPPPASQQYVLPRQNRRFEAIHLRHQSKRDSLDWSQLTPAQRSITKGYSDGFNATRTFALVDLSKLGFTGQYISDSIVLLGPSVIAPGTEPAYHDAFVRGLEDGQAIILSAVNPTVQ